MAIHSDLQNIQEYIKERSAIMEFEGGLTRPEAEREAMAAAIVRFNLNPLARIENDDVIQLEHAASMIERSRTLRKRLSKEYENH
jgi:hypothetical protein